MVLDEVLSDVEGKALSTENIIEDDMQLKDTWNAISNLDRIYWKYDKDVK